MRTGRHWVLLCVLLALQGCAEQDRRAAGAASSRLPATPPAGTLAAQNETALYLNVIEGLIKQQRDGAALAFLDDFAARRETSSRYWLLRGDALLGLGRQDEASTAYARLAGTVFAAPGWNGQGRIAAAGKDWSNATEKFRKAVQADPSNSDFLNNLAFAELNTGDLDRSAVHLRQAHELAPGSELIRNNLIIALTLTGDRSGADAILDGIKDGAHREEVKAMARAAIEKNNLDKDRKS